LQQTAYRIVKCLCEIVSLTRIFVYLFYLYPYVTR